MASRDEQTDSGRMGAPTVSRASRMQDAIDMDANTMAEAKAQNGWMTKDKPVGGEPNQGEYPEQY